MSLGVAPGLTLGMARSEGPVDRGELAGLFSVALGVMAAVAAVIVMIAVILAATGTFTSVADTLGATNPSDAAAALLCMVVLVAAQLVVVVPEGAQLGLQSQYVTNLWAGLGSAIAIGALIALGGQATTITAFILLAQLPQLVTRALNGIVFTSRRAYLLRPPAGSLRRHLPMLLGSGAAFTGFAVASYVGMQLGLLVLAVAADAGQVALAAVIVRG
ncbi:MAG TPA: hypothetical protein VFQ75_12935, partial [Candidatus Limnocylindrales bacterium]|nr:hypothetical protein [Candidatus Limnocylindrales bacterium]